MKTAKTTDRIDMNWSVFLRLTAWWQMSRYGKIYLDENGLPITDDEKVKELVSAA